MGDPATFESAAPRAAAPEDMVALTLAAAARDAGTLPALLETLPAPIYLTDNDGWITFFNRACVDFAGRTPVVGEDRWCVSWRLHTADGAPLSHAACPMAVAVRERRRVRGAVAVAERPDGTRVMFAPYPTPLFDRDGASIGAVNILIDVTDARQAGALRAQALRCRRLAGGINDPRTIDALLAMACEYDDKARSLDAV